MIRTKLGTNESPIRYWWCYASQYSVLPTYKTNSIEKDKQYFEQPFYEHGWAARCLGYADPYEIFSWSIFKNAYICLNLILIKMITSIQQWRIWLRLTFLMVLLRLFKLANKSIPDDPDGIIDTSGSSHIEADLASEANGSLGDSETETEKSDKSAKFRKKRGRTCDSRVSPSSQ